MTIWALNLRQLRAMAAIARLGSVSAAAQAVGISQPAITQGVAKLERQLGTKLFVRKPDGMDVTPAAQAFAPRVEAASKHIGSSRITLTQLRALIAVADQASYAGAGNAIGLSPPSIRRAVHDMGIALRRPLVERRGLGMVLTQTGRRTVRRCRLARQELEAGLSEVERLNGRETGKIAIGAMPLSRARLLPSAVAEFHKQHRATKILIAEGAYGDLIEPLRDGELDFLLGALRNQTQNDDLDQTALFTDRPVILSRRDHPLAKSRRKGLRSYLAYPWILPSAGTPLRDNWEAMFTDAGLSVPEVPIESGSVIAIRQILLETDFLTVLSPDQVAIELEANWLSQIGEAPFGFTRTIGIISRQGWRPTALQSEFLGVLTGKARHI